MTSIFRPILYLFSLLYEAIVRFRNHLFDISYSKSISFEVPVIVVGNLRVGGSGKTPFVEYLIHILKGHHKISTLSRGYKRKTFGFRLASPSDTPVTIGDEPFQIFQKFASDVVIAVGEERAFAIPQILMERPEVNLILMDDGFQHRQVKPAFSIILSDYKFPLVQDRLLPLGRLREPISSLQRAQALVITKCPKDIAREEMKKISQEISLLSKTQIPIFFSGYQLGDMVQVCGAKIPKSYILVAAVADPERVLADYKEKANIIGDFFYPDHYSFAETDLEQWCQKFVGLNEGEIGILCTEKDLAKIQFFTQSERWNKLSLSFFPLKINFIDREEEFKQILFSVLHHHGLSEND